MAAYSPLACAKPAYAADGSLYSERYGDIYHSNAGALAQSRHVFLAGNGLLAGAAARWCGRSSFSILETGFGLGLNFLATWQAWRHQLHRPLRLHYVAVEKHPFSYEDLQTQLALQPELTPYAKALLAAWPSLLPGWHRLHFEAGALSLTLILGDVEAVLPQMEMQADALYLDGFAPQRNPEMWSEKTVRQLFRLSGAGATYATWSVQSALRQHLLAAGFSCEKRAGLPPKRHMLVGAKPNSVPIIRRLASPATVAVIGAGLAGSAIAQRLAARGIAVTVIERENAPAQGASGNHVGVYRPLPAADDNALAQLLRAAFLYGRRHLQTLESAAVRWQACGVLHLARDAAHEALQQRIVREQAPPAQYLRYVCQEEATQLAAWPVPTGGWWFAGGGWVAPPMLCRANLEGIDTRFNAMSAALQEGDGFWHVLDAAGHTLCRADQVVLANGIDLQRLAPSLPVQCGRGMVTHVPTSQPRAQLACVVTRSGYVAPSVDGVHSVGATLQVEDHDMQPRLSDHWANLAHVQQMLPGWGADLTAEALAGRVGMRPLSPDRLPLVGAVNHSGLWALGGFGSRGLVWAALCAEMLAAQMLGEPAAVPLHLAAAVHPLRFAQRNARRIAAVNAAAAR